MKKTKHLAALAAMMALFAAGCDNGMTAAMGAVIAGQQDVPVESVEINPKTITIESGTAKPLTATVLPSNATDKTVTWSSSNEAVATVGEDGMVTAVSIGEATITALAGDKAATCRVTVKNIVVEVERVTLNVTTLTLTPGMERQLTATVEPNDATDKTVTWRSSNKGVATVDENGMVTAVWAGQATITASAGYNKSVTCNITVESTDAEKFEINENGMLTKYTGTDTDVTIPNGVTSIGGNAFSGCTSLASVTIPDGVTGIGRDAFNGCTSLASVTIPEGVTSIEEFAFYGCTSLESVVIPDSVTSIGEHAFDGCESLESVTIPEGVTSIEELAFYKCTNLTSVEIPGSVTSIGDSAFKYCTSLATINYAGTKDGWSKMEKDSYIFNNTKVTEITCTDGKFTVDSSGSITG